MSIEALGACRSLLDTPVVLRDDLVRLLGGVVDGLDGVLVAYKHLFDLLLMNSLTSSCGPRRGPKVAGEEEVAR